MDHTIPHDQTQIVVRVCENGDVAQRFAIYQQQVRVGTRLGHTKRTLPVAITWPRQREWFTAYAPCMPEVFCWVKLAASRSPLLYYTLIVAWPGYVVFFRTKARALLANGKIR